MLTRGTKVTIAGSLINFAIGTSYAWSVFAGSLISQLGWSNTAASLPYTLSIFTFAMVMAFAGRFQDRVGPRYGAAFSGLLAGLAFLLCALTLTPLGVTFSYGILFGAAVAFGYASVTPAAIKWFHPARRGLITGIVVTSHGIAALVLSPVLNGLLNRLGLYWTFLIWGVFLLALILSLSRSLFTPTEEKQQEILNTAAPTSTQVEPGPEQGWRETLRQPAFVVLWLMMALSAGAGLMLVANLVPIAEFNFRLESGYLLVSLFALCSATGRLGGGILTDRSGYVSTMKAMLLFMSLSMVLYMVAEGWFGVALATIFFGFTYGSLFTVFPAAVADLFGLKNFGANYGLLFTAVGIGGGLGPFTASVLADRFGSYNPAFFMGLFACLLAFLFSIYLGRIALVRRRQDQRKSLALGEREAETPFSS